MMSASLCMHRIIIDMLAFVQSLSIFGITAGSSGWMESRSAIKIVVWVHGNSTDWRTGELFNAVVESQ